MRSRVHRGRSRGVIALLATVFLVFFAHPAADAGMYTWIDDQGDRHLVDSREKVPPKYRSRAREVSSEDTRPAAPADRDSPGAAELRAPTLANGRTSEQAAGEASSRDRSRRPDWTSRWLEPLRTRWLAGLSAPPSVRERIARWLPREAALELAGVVAGLVVLVRTITGVRALRAARGLADFAARYRAVLERRTGGVDPAQVERLEQSLPRVHRWCRGARLGVTTIGASREVGMGRVMDEGRVDVLCACLTRPELVGQHTLAVLARAEGVHRHRARRPLSPLGCLEILVYWPRYLVWQVAEDEPGGVRVLLALYWLAVAGWVVVG